MISVIWSWIAIAIGLMSLVAFVIVPADYPKTNTVLFLGFTLGLSFGVSVLLG